MHRVGSWLSGPKPTLHGHRRSLDALKEAQQIESAMKGVSYIMNDDVDTAEALLSEGNSPFHKLGKGVILFLRAALGFEQDIMRDASNTLADAESSAYEFHRKAQRSEGSFHSEIFPLGTEFSLCLAEAQLMSAVVAVLNESLTESIKGFYKLRKAYVSLESISEAERAYLKRNKTRFESSSSDLDSRPNSALPALSDSAPSESVEITQASSMTPPNNDELETKPLPLPKQSSLKKSTPSSESEDEDFEFFEADETHEGSETPRTYTGHLEQDLSGMQRGVESYSARFKKRPGSSRDRPFYQLSRALTEATIKEGPDANVFGHHPVDIFTVSGSNLCYGLLNLIISLIPPAFATLLKIVGFRGDRDRGIEMLWQATKFNNINGAMGGLILFGYYNGLVGFCDIIPDKGPGSYPKERCMELLAEMRTRYPKSQLWLLEEARALASDKRLEEAVELMRLAGNSPLKQLQALQCFERSLNTMYMHDYENTSSSFQLCITLNNWSHGLYTYIAGAAHLELYRQMKTTDLEEAVRQADKAELLFKRVPQLTGKRRFMARQLPFDVFISRKIQKWEHRAQTWPCRLADAVGVSPIEEMIYFWNGYKRMRAEQLEDSLARLLWSTDKSRNPHWDKEDLDEHAIIAVLRAATLRQLKRTAESKDILQSQVIMHDRAHFKGPMKDNWTAPCAHYEMAACLWAERDGSADDPTRLKECARYLNEVARWDGYDLDARIGIKVTTAQNTLKRFDVDTGSAGV